MTVQKKSIVSASAAKPVARKSASVAAVTPAGKANVGKIFAGKTVVGKVMAARAIAGKMFT